MLNTFDYASLFTCCTVKLITRVWVTSNGKRLVEYTNSIIIQKNPSQGVHYDEGVLHHACLPAWLAAVLPQTPAAQQAHDTTTLTCIPTAAQLPPNHQMTTASQLSPPRHPTNRPQLTEPHHQRPGLLHPHGCQHHPGPPQRHRRHKRHRPPHTFHQQADRPRQGHSGQPL